GRMLLHQEPVTRLPGEDDPDSTTKEAVVPSAHRRTGSLESRFLIAAHWRRGTSGAVEPGGHYNGKIDGAKVFRRALGKKELTGLKKSPVIPARLRKSLLVAWDFARAAYSTAIRDSSPNHIDGRSVNFPTRAVTGHNWSGRESDFKRSP